MCWRGYKKETLEIEDIQDYSRLSGEELIIKLPYAGSSLTIRLLFDLYEPWLAPDLIFSDQSFMENILLKDLEEQVSFISIFSSNFKSSLI